MTLTSRQQRIKELLQDKLLMFRYAKKKSASDMEDIIVNIDQIVEGELHLGKGVKK